MRIDRDDDGSGTDSGVFAARSGSEHTLLLNLDALRPLQPQQSESDDVQIGQRAGYEQAMCVLLDAAVAHLGETEDSLDDADEVLDALALLRQILGRWSKPLNELALPGIGAVAPDM